MQRVWLGLTRSQVFSAGPWMAGLARSAYGTIFPPPGLQPGDRAPLRLRAPGGCANFRYKSWRADVLTVEEVLLSHGPVVDALLASAPIPGAFPPVVCHGRLVMDRLTL